MTQEKKTKEKVFTKYQVFMIVILAIIQFTVVLDFMVLSPLLPTLSKEMVISASQFTIVVAAYAFSAGIAGLLAAGFADKFDRKKLLIFFYTGFVMGTLLCAIAPTYEFLLVARIVAGLFGGVISSVSFAIISDLFKMEVRGRVMGFVQMAFAASQVLGLPIGLELANKFGWHSCFWMIVVFAILVGVVIIIYMQAITGHLKLKSDRNAFQHLIKTTTQVNYLKGFLATTLLATGGFMLMPLGGKFATNNLGLTVEQLTPLYAVTGVFSIIFGPLLGKLSDKIGKYKLFVIGSVIAMIMVCIYCHSGVTPLWLVITINVVLFIGISARMISSSALMTAVPEPQDRGAFMSVNSSVQQISGGIASIITGLIVVETKSGLLERYDILGYVVMSSMVVCAVMMYFINNYVNRKTSKVQ